MSLAQTTAFTLYLSDLEPPTEEKLRLICDAASESRPGPAIDELDIYTTGEVEERLYQVQEHCEGLNHLETEDMVLDAKSDLENDVREEINDAKRDLQSWYQRRVQPKIAKMIEAEVQAAEGRVMDAVRLNMGRIAQRRRHHGHGPVAFESGQRFRRRLRTAWLRAEEAMRRVEATREASTASTDSADECLFGSSNS
ncbi:hypothetical protein VPNG_09601 [Cytospora leucostoma]|uniref:Uncharacterized protein n=1 Tax=Cytospora leucostoma TaxID=1230097 RepID=A0A423VN57_9PEZI|nr:hypothetical protein VPNG_09601 [Cytospora leucostoma]